VVHGEAIIQLNPNLVPVANLRRLADSSESDEASV
jgi:hypothetical protein